MNRTMWTNDERRGDALYPAKEQKQKQRGITDGLEGNGGPIGDGSQEQRMYTHHQGVWLCSFIACCYVTRQP